jgi:hypothetical protein
MNSLLAALLILTPAACRAVPSEPQAFYVQDGVVSSSSGSGDGYVQLNVDNDHGQLLLILHGDKVTALLDGEVLPGERIVRDGDKLTVRGPDGSSLFEVRVIEGSHSLVYPYDAKAWSVSPDGLFTAAGNWGGAHAVGNRRKLIGISTSPVGGALREQLGLSEDAFVVESVTDGMPAQLGGVKPFDIVTAIEGEPASTDRLHAVLDAKEPGDSLGITVLRQGQPTDLTLTVQEPRQQSVFGYGLNDLGQFADSARQWRNADGQALQELLAAHASTDAERARLADQLAKVEAEVQKAHQDHGADAARLLVELSAQQASLTARRAEMEAAAAAREGAMALFNTGDAGRRWLMLPSAGSDADVAPDRLAQLEERLARLEELLERLAARGSGDAGAPDAQEDKQP